MQTTSEPAVVFAERILPSARQTVARPWPSTAFGSKGARRSLFRLQPALGQDVMDLAVRLLAVVGLIRELQPVLVMTTAGRSLR